MTCNDCPNQLADSDMCCHPSTKYHGTDFDDRANDEADRHAQMMQKQRKTDSVSNVDPMIDWTTSDYQLQLQQDKNKDDDHEIQRTHSQS